MRLLALAWDRMYVELTVEVNGIASPEGESKSNDAGSVICFEAAMKGEGVNINNNCLKLTAEYRFTGTLRCRKADSSGQVEVPMQAMERVPWLLVDGQCDVDSFQEKWGAHLSTEERGKSEPKKKVAFMTRNLFQLQLDVGMLNSHNENPCMSLGKSPYIITMADIMAVPELTPEQEEAFLLQASEA